MLCQVRMNFVSRKHFYVAWGDRSASGPVTTQPVPLRQYRLNQTTSTTNNSTNTPSQPDPTPPIPTQECRCKLETLPMQGYKAIRKISVTMTTQSTVMNAEPRNQTRVSGIKHSSAQAGDSGHGQMVGGCITTCVSQPACERVKTAHRGSSSETTL